jgi:peptide chain release factor subunit 1
MEKSRLEKAQPEVLPKLKRVDPKVLKKTTGRVEPDIAEADLSVLRSLAELGPGPRILSVYVNLDPNQFPTPRDRESEVISLLDDAARRVEELEPEEKKALRKDVDELRTYFLEKSDWAKGVRSLAVFCSGERDLFEILRLSVPVASTVAIETTPFLEPVVGAVPERRLCVALVDRATARIFCGSEAGLEEVTDVRDDVHGQHDQGGWSQARYQRSVEDDVEDHLKNVAARLLELHKEGQIERLMVGCTEELLPRFLDKLHSYLRERFAGRIEIDVQNSLAGEVLAKAREVLEEEDRRKEQELFERLRRELAVRGKAVAGLEPTLAALNESRVETLLVREGLVAPGVFCPRCGWLGSVTEGEAAPGGGRRCPVDGGELEQTDNVVEKAMERTLMLSGTTWVPRFETDLDQRGGIAALLRF